LAFPTDTVYGLGCDPRNPQAVKKLLSVKGKRKKPFPILVSSQRMAARIATMNTPERVLASRFWPGPLTLILKSRHEFSLSSGAPRKTVAVRYPKNDVTLKLIRKCGGLLIGTSANRTGEPPCTSARMVRRMLDDVDAVVDGGPTPARTASTVVRVHSCGVTVLRKGPIRELQIKRALHDASSRSTRRR
jgi:L-threonylcarbamoyladenylate synthase